MHLVANVSRGKLGANAKQYIQISCQIAADDNPPPCNLNISWMAKPIDREHIDEMRQPGDLIETRTMRIVFSRY